ncbi:MAG: hypothetical protein RR982_02655 [Kiritimatiellia bacterium]
MKYIAGALRWFCFFTTLMVGAEILSAQKALEPVSVGIAFNAGSSCVIGEKIPVQVLIRNNTAQRKILGQGVLPSAVFEIVRVNDTSRRSVAYEGASGIPSPLILGPSEQRVFDINLAEVANLSAEGKYFVKFGAIDAGIRYDTQLKVVEIVPGYIVAEGTQLFSNDPKRQRHFTLVRWARDHVDCLFLRVSDTPDGRWFPTVPLGAYLQLVKPRLNIATNGELTLLHRATPEYYVRNVFWSFPDDFVHRSRLSLLDPGTADTNRLSGLRNDLDEIIQKNEKLKDELRLR